MASMLCICIFACPPVYCSALIFLLIYACSNGTPDGKLLDLGGYFSGVICPSQYVFAYIHNKYTSRGVSGHLCTWNYCSFCVLILVFWCGGLLSILAPGFLGCLTLNVRSDQISMSGPRNEMSSLLLLYRVRATHKHEEP